MVAATQPQLDPAVHAANDQTLQDPLSAFASASTLTVRDTIEGNHAPRGPGPSSYSASGIQSSAGNHYFDLKAIQARLQDESYPQPQYPSGFQHTPASRKSTATTPSLRADSASSRSRGTRYDDDDDDDDDADDDLRSVSAPRSDAAGYSDRGDGEDEDDDHDGGSRTGALTPKSTLSIARESSPLPSSTAPPLQAPRPQRSDGNNVLHSAAWRSRPPSRAAAASPSPLFPSHPRPQHQNSLSSLWQHSDGVRGDDQGDDDDTDFGDESLAQDASTPSFLAKLHLMTDEELDTYLQATVRSKSSTRAISTRPVPSPPGPSSQSSLHSDDRGSSSKQSFGLNSQEQSVLADTSSLELCRKLSRALAAALSECASTTQRAEEQADDYERRIDVLRRTHETREKAILSVCEQHGVASGTIDRAVARALADMPQATIDVQEQAYARRVYSSSQPSWQGAGAGAGAGAGDRDRRSRRTPANAEVEPSLHMSLQEAMLDDLGSAFPSLPAPASPTAFSSRSVRSKRSPSGTSSAGVKSVNATTPRSSTHSSCEPTGSQRSKRSGTVYSTVSVSSAAGSAGQGDSTPGAGQRRSSRALMPWARHTTEDRKASATIKAISPAAVEADGYMSDGGYPDASVHSQSDADGADSSAIESRYSISHVAAAAAATPPATKTASGGNLGFFSSLAWRRRKPSISATPKASVPNTDIDTTDDAATPTRLQDGRKLAPPSTPKSRTSPTPSPSRAAAASAATAISALDRTTSGRDVSTALHEAIGPPNPSEEHLKKFDPQALPKPSSLRAIFLSTRILGADASSLLINSGRKTTPLVAKLSLDLITHAREEGLQVNEPQKSSDKRNRLGPFRGPSTPRSAGGVAARQRADSSTTPKQRPQSMAIQAAAAVVDAATSSTAATMGRTAARRGKEAPRSRLAATPAVEPNVTRLPQLFGFSGSSQTSTPSSKRVRAVKEEGNGAAVDADKPAPPLELEPIVPLDGKPPTLALFARQSATPAQRGPSARRSQRPSTGTLDNVDEESSGDEFEVYGGKGNVSVPEPVRSTSIGFDDRAVDVFGFVYDATPADVRLLKQARKASTPAPACLTGIRVGVAARGGSESQSEEEGQDLEDDNSDSGDIDDDEGGRLPNSPSKEDGPGHSAGNDEPAADDASYPLQEDATHPVGLLGITRAKPSTEKSGLVASFHINGEEGGPTSPSQERDFKLIAQSGNGGAETEKESPVPAQRPPAAKTPKPTSETVKRLLDQLKVMHSEHQAAQKAKWDSFIQHRRDALAQKSEAGAGASAERKRQGAGTASDPCTLAPPTTQDEYQFGLVGMRQMGDDRAGKEDWKQFLRLCQDGIPLAHRPKVWAETSGAHEVAEPGRYQDLLNDHEGENNQCLMQIDLDIHRTMPTNIYFGGEGPGVPKLRRVLAAYSWYSPEIGYCQGMNNLAATLLLTHATEEEAFWVLVCIIEKILPAEYYTSHLLVSQADQRVLIDLVKEFMPALADHLEDLGVDLPAVTFAWFLSLYTDCLPVETLFRVWDLFFAEGMVVLFRVAMGILMMNERELLATESPAAFYGHVHSMTSRLFSVDRLLQLACQDLRAVITDEKIVAKRQRHVTEIKAELGLE